MKENEIGLEKQQLEKIVIASTQALKDQIAQTQFVEKELRSGEQHLIKTLKKAKDAAQAKDIFLANMSHEIRTPLTAIMGMTELLRGTPLNETQQRYVNILETASGSLLNLINDILDISRLESANFKLEKEAFQIKSLVQEVIAQLANKAEEKNISLEHQIAPTINKYHFGDFNRIKQILWNLVENAIKFSPQGQVLIKVEKYKADRLLFCVKDQGPGIPLDQQNIIFDTFDQIDATTTRKTDGTGLGLAICYKLVKLMGGTVWVESDGSSGSQFYFILPFDNPITMDLSAPNAFLNSINEVTPRRNRRILLVDDVEVNRILVETYLDDQPYELDFAFNGQIGLEMFSAKVYDLILMDIQMPIMDGLQATAAIRTIEKKQGSPRIPIVAFTAHVLPQEVERSLASGCDYHLGKPVQREKLIETIDLFIH